jgi:flagellar biosynthesis/type III secretory pathway chaperone
MSALNAATATIEDPRNLLIDVIQEGMDVLSEERKVFLTGAYARLQELAERKLAILGKLENIIPQVGRSATVLQAMNALITESRRNEEIIQAARQGLAQARRRITAIRKTRSGAVAYAEDGTTIMSRADELGPAKSA